MKKTGMAVAAAAILAVTLGWISFDVGRGPTANAAAPAGATIPWGGGSWNLHGVNMAWYNWACDFGCGANGGVSSTRGTLAPRFAQLDNANVRNVRWWMFEGNAWQVERDASGMPTRVNPAVYADIDAALALADHYDLYYTFVIFNFPGDIPASWLNDPAQRQQLADVLAPMFARYSGNPRVLSWEVFNEPEWDMWNNKVSTPNTQALVRAVIDAVHANSTAYATVGSAEIDGLPFWTGMGLDYYQAHWYDYMQPGNWCARCRDYSDVRQQYNLDAPLVIGEFYAGPDTDALQRWEDFYSRGYAGAWAWSLWPEKTADRMAVDLGAAATFASRHPGTVGPHEGMRTLPIEPITQPPTPTATSTARARRTATPPPATATPSPSATATQPPATATATQPPSTATQPPATATQPPATATQPPATSVPANWQTSASTSVSTVARGTAMMVQGTVRAPQSGKFLVDVEVYSPSGQKVYQKWFDNTSFVAGQAKSFDVGWTPPANAATGTWTVKIGVFKPGWASLVHWDNGAAQFKVR